VADFLPAFERDPFTWQGRQVVREVHVPILPWVVDIDL
jgi:hypothetical protein